MTQWECDGTDGSDVALKEGYKKLARKIGAGTAHCVQFEKMSLLWLLVLAIQIISNNEILV